MGKSDLIISYLERIQSASSSQIYDEAGLNASYATIRRELTKLVDDNILITEGKGRSSKYTISPSYRLLYDINIEQYYQKEIDERIITDSYNFDLINLLNNTPSLFTKEETSHLSELQSRFTSNISNLTEAEKKLEMDRLGIDLSWKSSQIEGNTYSLLETERLIKEKETAQGKSKDEAIMLLNHKDALDFIVEHPDFLSRLSVTNIENIHSLLTKELAIDKNIRRRKVGITGTNYTPLDNEYQIREALEALCNLINSRDNIFEQALLILLLISYIQPFSDGNKRTARIVSNAILIANNYCPISYRSVDSIDYKKAMLIFYEQNNLSAFKQIFINQFAFAVNTYF